jgi:hypothetical protein
MCAPLVHHRLPRAGIDRIDRPEAAIITVAMAIHRPLRAETITLLLDHERRGVAVAVVTDTRQPDAVLEVVECLTRTSAHGGRVGAIVVATVRPGAIESALLAADVDRWLEMSDIAEQAGVELVEWFVVGSEIMCPRDLLGEPPRW